MKKAPCLILRRNPQAFVLSVAKRLGPSLKELGKVYPLGLARGMNAIWFFLLRRKPWTLIRVASLIIFGLSVFYPFIAESKMLKLDDFDRCQKPNLISGDYGAWNKTEWDRSQYCNESYTTDPRVVYKGKGCSLVLDYDVDAFSQAYNGFWMRFEKTNLNKYRNFVFYVRGDIKKGYSSRFKLEIKSVKGDISSFEVEGIDSSWRKITVPLGDILNDGDFSEAYEFTIVFDSNFVTSKIGRIYLDEIYLE